MSFKHTKELPILLFIGLMDIALITANANQLRFLITYNSEEKTFYISATLIILSLFVQVFVGIGMIYRVCIHSKCECLSTTRKVSIFFE